MASVADICMPCPTSVYILIPGPTPVNQPAPPVNDFQVLSGYGPPNPTVNIPAGGSGIYYDLNPNGSIYKWNPATSDWSA